MRAWTRSLAEELLSGIWLIAGLLAWQAELKVLAWLLFARCVSDTLCSVRMAVRQRKKGEGERWFTTRHGNIRGERWQ